jgi:hypothetical protein
VLFELPVPGAPACSVAVTAQKPTVDVAVRVTVAWPLAFVTAVGALKLAAVHVAPGLPTTVNVIVSPATGFAPTPVVTVAVIVEVLVPSARMLDGFAEIATLFGT